MTSVRQPNPDDDFELREVSIPMRDAVGLHTLILVPKHRAQALPLLLLRTPYDATRYLRCKQRTSLKAVLGTGYADLDGYIFVFQDLRGRSSSGGEFELVRPTRGALNSSATDETTDAWDTIEWLVGNVAEGNGRVGLYGTSYEGWATLMALLDPHPALEAAVPHNPLVDGWKGDDWFHHGAFRQTYAFEYVYAMQTTRGQFTPFAFDHYDSYVWWLRSGSPAAVGERYLNNEQHPFWKALMANPEYSSYWQQGALDQKLRDSSARLVDTLMVHSWFDQEDQYGAPAAYAALKHRDVSNSHIHLVAGPWYHGQSWLSSSQASGPRWSEDAAAYFRRHHLAPFLKHHLADGPAHELPAATLFDTGTRQWGSHDCWPPNPNKGGSALFLQTTGGLSWKPPESCDAGSRSYLSDPSNPVPYQPRPVRRVFHDELDPMAWRTWLMADQRFVDGRPDVLTYLSDVVSEEICLRGPIVARLWAQTSASDADWVVKLIDVFPDLDPADLAMSGYQLMISGDIFRARYRSSLTEARPLTSDRPLKYTFELPQVNHTFRPGHRLMVQIQSTWFPLYDRNPQRFVESIMKVKADDYARATHTIHSSASHPSHLEVWVQK